MTAQSRRLDARLTSLFAHLQTVLEGGCKHCRLKCVSCFGGLSGTVQQKPSLRLPNRLSESNTRVIYILNNLMNNRFLPSLSQTQSVHVFDAPDCWVAFEFVLLTERL
jgi:hypothetical protein